jgi:hypothetical protein
MSTKSTSTKKNAQSQQQGEGLNRSLQKPHGLLEYAKRGGGNDFEFFQKRGRLLLLLS